MAFAAVTVCLQTLDQTFSSNPFLDLDKDEHCQFLSEKLGVFQRFLLDSTNKCNDLEKMEDLERQIRDVSYRAQDYVEELAFFSWKDMDLLECYDRVYSTKGCLSKIVDEIKLIELEVMKIYEQMSCPENVYESESYLLDESSAEKSPVVQDIVVGLQDGVLEIKTRLCSFSSKLEIASLVGMGGIGKSTLAKMVYDDAFIKYHFSIRAWVTVKDRQVKGLLLGLLDGIVEFTDEIHEKHSEQLAEMLYRKLKLNRYLIVLDDVWSTEVWDKIRRCFPDDKNGSRILLTTRLTEVALHAKSDSSPYCLKFLDLERSWELLCHKVFGRKFDHPDLEDIGKKIAERCQGLPLTILVVAGQLSKIQRTRMCWETFAKTVGSVVTDEHKNCLDILALSYRNLPHHLKACFIYICAFPAETAIHVPLLVKVWTAEGFLTTGKQKTLENYAEECLDDLVNRSLVIVKERRSNGRVKSCAVHDLLRDLGLREAQRENFFHFPEFSVTADTLHCGRRLSYHSAASIGVPWKPLLPLSRTLFLSSSEIALPHLGSQLLGSLLYKLLRVLHIVHVTFDYFPTQVLQLVHLRYLALTVKEPKCPELISRLWNLQTFILDTHGILARVQEEQKNMGNDSLNVSIPEKGSLDVSILENGSIDVSIPENDSLDVSVPEKGCLNVSIPENVSVNVSVTVRGSLKVSISAKGSFNIFLEGKGSLNVSIPEKGSVNVFVPVKGSLNVFDPGKGIFSIFVPVKGSLNVSIQGKGSFYVPVPVNGSLNVFIPEKGSLDLFYQPQSS